MTEITGKTKFLAIFWNVVSDRLFALRKHRYLPLMIQHCRSGSINRNQSRQQVFHGPVQAQFIAFTPPGLCAQQLQAAGFHFKRQIRLPQEGSSDGWPVRPSFTEQMAGQLVFPCLLRLAGHQMALQPAASFRVNAAGRLCSQRRAASVPSLSATCRASGSKRQNIVVAGGNRRHRRVVPPGSPLSITCWRIQPSVTSSATAYRH